MNAVAVCQNLRFVELSPERRDGIAEYVEGDWNGEGKFPSKLKSMAERR